MVKVAEMRMISIDGFSAEDESEPDKQSVTVSEVEHLAVGMLDGCKDRVDAGLQAPEEVSCGIWWKTRGGRLVDIICYLLNYLLNRPSTNQLHHFVKKIKNMTPDS